MPCSVSFVFHRRQHHIPSIQRIASLGRVDPPPRPQVHRAGGEVVGQHLGLGLGGGDAGLADGLEDQPLGAVDVVAVADADVVLDPPLWERGVHGHAVGEQLRVGNDHPPTVVGTDKGSPRLNILNRAFIVFEADLVVDTKRLCDQEQHPAR